MGRPRHYMDVRGRRRVVTAEMRPSFQASATTSTNSRRTKSRNSRRLSLVRCRSPACCSSGQASSSAPRQAGACWSAPPPTCRAPAAGKPYEGIVETDRWFGPLITNLRLTKTDVPIDFRPDFPLLQAQPIPRHVYEDATLNNYEIVPDWRSSPRKTGTTTTIPSSARTPRCSSARPVRRRRAQTPRRREPQQVTSRRTID